MQIESEMKTNWKMWENHKNQEKQHDNRLKNPHKTT